MKKDLPVLATLTFMTLTACGQPAATPAGASGPVAAADAVCRPTPNGRQATGCYLTLTADADDRLMAVESPIGSLAQIHQTRIESNMMMMRPLADGLPLPAGEAVALKPGGSHIMLLGVQDPLVAGDTVPLTLTFATAAPVSITAAVGQPETADDHTGH